MNNKMDLGAVRGRGAGRRLDTAGWVRRGADTGGRRSSDRRVLTKHKAGFKNFVYVLSDWYTVEYSSASRKGLQAKEKKKKKKRS